MVRGVLAGYKAAVSLPTSVDVCAEVRSDVSRFLDLIPDASVVCSALMEYLMLHGKSSDDEVPKVVPFDLGKILHPKLEPMSKETELALRNAAQQARLAVITDDADADVRDGEACAAAETKDVPLHLAVHPCGTIRRAVATGFAMRLLIGLQPTSALQTALSQLQPQVPLANSFYVGDCLHYTVDEAVKAASKRRHVSVTHLPDSEFFDIAEGVLLYNPSQYWSLMTTSEVNLCGEDEAPAADVESDGKPVRLMTLWRSRWFEALVLVRRALFARDYGAFFTNSPYLVLAGRFAMEVPEFPPLRSEDRQGSVFEAILHRVDRNSVQKFGAFIQRAVSSGRCEYTVRQAKNAGVIRAIGEAIGSIRTPIKTVDLCFQALTIIAQNVRCHRPSSLCFHELFPSGYAGDLLEHGFVTASGRNDDALGVSIPSLITKNFLHRRDAWAVLSHLHPSFVHINERLVQEACRRALPQHFAVQDPPHPKADQTDASPTSPTHYRASEDLFMVASATVILSHAATNANARRSQLVNLRPCVGSLMSGVMETLRSGHTKIPGWIAQQTRLALASIRIVQAVVQNWIQDVRGDRIAATNEAGGEKDASEEQASPDHPPLSENVPTTFVAMNPALLSDLCRVIAGAPLISCLMSTTLQVVNALVQESLTNEIVAALFKDEGDAALQEIVNVLRQRFVDRGFDEVEDSDDATFTELKIKEEVVKSVLTILMTICLKHNNRGDAGSIIISLGVHHCADWGLEVVQMVTSGGVPLPASCDEEDAAQKGKVDSKRDEDILFASTEMWQRLAHATHAVYKELFEHCDVTAVAAVAGTLGQLLRLQPLLTSAFDDMFQRAVEWLGRPIFNLLEEEERRLETELAATCESITREEAKGIINTSRNTILCALLDLVKCFTLTNSVASDEGTIPSLCSLVQAFRHEAPYLNPLLQALLSAAGNGARRAAFHPHRALLRSVADVSKTSGKLSIKLFAILDDKDFKKQQSKEHKDATCREVPTGQSGVTSDKMEFLDNSQNAFQRLVSTPSAAAAKSNPDDQPRKETTIGSKVPKGFTLIVRHTSTAKRLAATKEEVSRSKVVRSSQGKAKDAQRRDEVGRKHSVMEPAADEKSSYGRKDDKATSSQHRQSLESASMRGADPSASVDAADASKVNKKLVNMRGDDGGINLDLLTLRIAQKQQKSSSEEHPTKSSKPTSWANVAKSAKSVEEREEEATRAAADEEERLQQAASERAARRKAAQDEERRRQEADRRRNLEEEIKRNRGAIDVVDSNRSSAPAAVDVHALLNLVLTAPGSVVRKAQSSDHTTTSRAAPPAAPFRLAASDDEEVGLGTVPTIGANAAIASLAQLRLGSEGSTVVHRVPYTAPRQQPAQQHAHVTSLLQPPGYHVAQPAQQQPAAPQLQPPPQKDPSPYFTTSTVQQASSIWQGDTAYNTTQPTLSASSLQRGAGQQQEVHQDRVEEWGVQSVPAASLQRSSPPQQNTWANTQAGQPMLHYNHHHTSGSNHNFPTGYSPSPTAQQGHHHQYTASPPPPQGGGGMPFGSAHMPPQTSFASPPHSAPVYNQPLTSYNQPPQAAHESYSLPPQAQQLQQSQRVWLPGMNTATTQELRVGVTHSGNGAVPSNSVSYNGASSFGPSQTPPSVSIGYAAARPPQATVTVGGRQTSWPQQSYQQQHHYQQQQPQQQQQQQPSFPVGHVPTITVGRSAHNGVGQQPAFRQQSTGTPPTTGGEGMNAARGAVNPYATASTPGGFGF